MTSVSRYRQSLAVSVLIHAAAVLLFFAMGGFEARRPPAPDRIVDVIDLQNFLPASSAPKLDEVPQPPAPPSLEQPAEKQPKSDEPPPVRNPNVLHENLAPAAEGSTGMTVATAPPLPPAPRPESGDGGEGEFLPQFRITEIPVVPGKEVLAKIKYPPLAAKQGIQAVVYLELFINKAGKVVRISVLKDPGYGFAEAAVKALEGVVCVPGKMNGEPVAVRLRYPVRFALR